ncbi:MAG: collagen binding domain-containing protein [Ruminococcus sp.]
MTTTTTIVVCKQDAEGNLLGGASLQLTAEDGTVTAAWISENGTPYLLPELTPDCIYQLSELKAPADFALAEPIYFRLTGDGMLQLLNITTEADGTSWTVTGVAEELTDGRIVMVDAYLGTGTLATTTTTEETTTTTAEETTTTTMRRTDSGNGEQTPTTTTTAETTTGGGTDHDHHGNGSFHHGKAFHRWRRNGGKNHDHEKQRRLFVRFVRRFVLPQHTRSQQFAKDRRPQTDRAAVQQCSAASAHGSKPEAPVTAGRTLKKVCRE